MMLRTVTRRRAAAGALTAAVVAVVIILATAGGGSSHTVSVTVPDATGVLTGQSLRISGQVVGQIASAEPVDRGRAAKLTLTLDQGAWPLPHGTTMRLRWGGTVSYLQRYIDVILGPRDGPSYADGATLPSSTFTTPVEFDTLINDFTPRVRAGVHVFLQRGGTALANASTPLKATIQQAPSAVVQASHLLTALDSVRSRLTSLLSSSADVVAAIHDADPTIEQAVTGAGETFSALASRAAALQGTLAAGSATFAHVRDTLGRADGTLNLAASLSSRISPGISELRQTVAPLDRLLTTLVGVGPQTIGTLSTARRSAPQVTSMLAELTKLTPEIGSILRQAIPQLGCIRPYTPDIMSFFTNWNRFWDYTDGPNYYARVAPGEIAWAPTTVMPYTSGQAAKIFPSLRYQFPRPPGYDAGQPWFQPQCGAGPSALDPNLDPEARPGTSFSLPSLTAGKAR